MIKKLPTYSVHKASGNARVWLGGKNCYLGAYNSPELRLAYAELLQKHFSGVLIDPVTECGPSDSGPTVNEICAAYLLHADEYYRKDGVRTAEYDCVLSAMRSLKAV